MNEIISGLEEASNNTESKTKTPSILTWLSANFAYATLILLPIFSFASYLSFLGLGRNYLEHIVLNSYVTGQQAIFYSIFLLPKVFIDDIYYLESIPFIVSILYAFLVFWQFLREGNRTIHIFRSILTYILYMVLSSGFLYILVY